MVHHVVVVRVGVGGALTVPHLLGLVQDLCKKKVDGVNRVNDNGTQ